MNSFHKLLQKDIESYLAGFLFGAIILIIFFEVLTRAVFYWTFSGSEEVTILFFIWFVMLGAVTTTKKYAHIKIDFLVSRLNPSLQRFLYLLVDLLVIFFLIFFILSGIGYAKFEMHSGSAILEIPDVLYILPIPICGFLMMIYRLLSVTKTFRKLISKSEDN